MPSLSDEDKEVIDPESVKQFEQSLESEGDAPDPDPESGDTPPEKVTVTVNGQELEVSPEVAAAIEAQQEQFRREREALKQEVLSEVNPQPEPSHKGVTKDEFDEDEFWTNPAAAVQKVVDKRVGEAREEFQQHQRKTEDQRKFWSSFYDKHPELKEDEDIVQMILDRDYSTLADMEIDKAQDELAKRAAKRIGKTLQSKPGGNRRTETTSGSPPSEGPKKEEPKVERKSLSQVLKERRQQRHEPATRRKAG